GMNGNYWYWLTSLLLCLAIAGCMGGTAGTSEPDPSATAHGFTPAHPAGKPGARVNLEDATPEEITPGAVASREVRLRADYSGGILQVQVTAEEGLEIVSQQREFRFVLEPDNRYSLPLDLFAARPGRYYLNLHIRVE